MADCFEMGEACCGTSAGFQPFIDRTRDHTRGSQVMCKEFGMTFDVVGKILLQNNRDPGVQFLPSSAQQRAVGSVLQQRMLEDVGGMRSGATTIEQSRL